MWKAKANRGVSCKLLRRTLRMCAILGLTLSAVACGNASSGNANVDQNSGSSGNPLTIRVGYTPISMAPFHWAKKNDGFKKYGVKPSFVQFSSGTAGLAALKSGSIDVLEEGAGPLVLGVASGVDQIAVAVVDDQAATAGLVARAGSGINSVKDLRGKTLASLQGSGEYYSMLQGLQKNGLTLKDVHFKDLDPAGILAAFKAGDIDAAWMWDPWAELLAQENGRVVTHDIEQGLREPIQWVVNKTWAESHKRAVAAFLKSIDAAIPLVKGNLQEAANLMAPVMHVPEPVAQTLVSKLAANEGWPTINTQLSKSYQLSYSAGYAGCSAGFAKYLHPLIEQLIKDGKADAMIPCSQLYTPEYLQLAQKM